MEQEMKAAEPKDRRNEEEKAKAESEMRTEDERKNYWLTDKMQQMKGGRCGQHKKRPIKRLQIFPQILQNLKDDTPIAANSAITHLWSLLLILPLLFQKHL